jgi:hypothetical protein
MRKTINPFRFAGGEIIRRLAWDVRPESWRSRRRLRSLHDQHVGDACVILCNGPSLLKADFGTFGSVFTFGLNKINLLFERSDYRPSCVVAVNKLVLEQNAKFYNSTNIPLFLDSTAIERVAPRPNITFLHSSRHRGFAEDVSISVSQGGTVTNVALQLAFHMGFARVALVGCDHDYGETMGRPNSVATSTASDPSHFDPRYFAGGAKWHLPDLLQSELSYRMALDAFQDAGRLLVNATVGGKLEIFPRMPLTDFLAGQSR